jgi:hypothetical protein
LAVRKQSACKKNEIIPVDIDDRRKTADESILYRFYAVFSKITAATISESREMLDFFLS